MARGKYKNIFFDLDDTLYDFTAASRESFGEVYTLLGYERFFDSFDHYMNIYKPHNLMLWGLYGKGEITKEELNRRRFAYPLMQVGVDDAELSQQFCTEALARIPTKAILVPHAVQLLDYLHPKYRLFILSNGFQELQARKMRTSGILHYFTDIILSDHIGVNKPDRRIFEYALEKSGSRREDSLMVGDMFETDIAGAHAIGMDQIFYENQPVGEVPFEPTYRVASLLDIMDIL